MSTTNHVSAATEDSQPEHPAVSHSKLAENLRPFPKLIDTRITALFYGGAGQYAGRGYIRDDSRATAVLAQLRHNLGKPVGIDPAILTWTLADLPQRFDPRQRDDVPTPMEYAAHTTMTLYALHQQSNHESSAHRLDTSLGRACAYLHAKTTNTKGVERRFAAIQTSTDWEETVRHARGLIQLFKREKQPFDYAAFAEDLIALRDPDRANGVRLRWGRDFARPVPTAKPGTESGT